MNRSVLRHTRWVLLLLLTFCLPCSPAAKVKGMCADCHTMHNSQNGEFITDNGVPLRGLLRNSCAGCHQGTNIGGAVPYIWDYSEPVYGSTGTESATNTLAAGSFYWVASGNHAAGHNVAGVAGVDSRLGNLPPGGIEMGAQLTCAGVTGCHGDRNLGDPFLAMVGSHHGEGTTGWQDGTTIGRSFRFLKGVQGMEDPLFEYRPSAASHHNKYYGIDRSSAADVNGTVSALCGDCHGKFYHGNGEIAAGSFGSSAWLRHPTDFDMGRVASGTEFAGYNGGTGTANPYSVVSPVATASTTTTLNTTVYAEADDAVVMCLSCHRAHGSPHAASLRWDYKAWPAAGYNGCAVCHSVKN